MKVMLFQLLTSDTTDKLFGGGISSAPFSGGSIGQNFSTIFSFFINGAIVVASFFTLIYLMWGVFDFISAGGESDKLKKAQSKMTTAVIGIVILIAILTVWLFIVKDVLGILRSNNNGFDIKLPTLKDQIQPTQAPGNARPTIPFE